MHLHNPKRSARSVLCLILIGGLTGCTIGPRGGGVDDDAECVCEWLPAGSNCEATLPPGEYALYGANESDWCWLESDPFTLGAGEDFDYSMGGSDVIFK